MKKILSALSICFVILASLCLSACGTPQSPTSVMTMSVNPEVQFVLDQNNKVINVTATNKDGERLIANVNFKGKTAEEASKLFVQVATELGKIDVDATVGTTVTINISAEKTEKFDELKTKVQNSVNEYFKNNGILAGAKVISEDVKEALEKIGADATALAGKTYEEILDYANNLADNLDNISIDVRNEVLKAIDTIKGLYKTTIETFETTISELEKQLNSSKWLPEATKQEIQKQINEAKASLQKELTKMEKAIDEKMLEFQEQCKNELAKIKTDVENAIKIGKETIKNHKDAFEQNKQEIIDQITAFQATLNA